MKNRASSFILLPLVAFLVFGSGAEQASAIEPIPEFYSFGYFAAHEPINDTAKFSSYYTGGKKFYRMTFLSEHSTIVQISVESSISKIDLSTLGDAARKFKIDSVRLRPNADRLLLKVSLDFEGMPIEGNVELKGFKYYVDNDSGLPRMGVIHALLQNYYFCSSGNERSCAAIGK